MNDGRATLAEQSPGRAAVIFEQHSDAVIAVFLPGLGTILGARVPGEFGDVPDRYATAKPRRNHRRVLARIASDAA